MLKKALTDSLIFFKNHLWAIAAIILPIVIPVDLFTAIHHNYIAGEELTIGDQLLPMMIGLVAYPIYSAAVIFYIAAIITDQQLDTPALWKLGLKYWARYLILMILVGVVTSVGFILLIIPGIYFTIRYSFSELYLLLENDKPTEAMRNSWDATKEYIWVILGGYAIISVVFYVPYALLYTLIETNMGLWPLELVLNVGHSVISVLYTIFAFRVYEIAKSQHNKVRNDDTP